MNSQDTNEKANKSRFTAAAIFGIALPFIAIGGALGAMIGSALGSITNGFRVGVILGGVVAFAVLQRKKASRAS